MFKHLDICYMGNYNDVRIRTVYDPLGNIIGGISKTN